MTLYPFFPNVPTSLALPGFSGLTTNIQQFSADPFNPNPTYNALNAGTASRSTDGNSITIQSFTNPAHSSNIAGSSSLTIAITTNARGFQLSDTGYQPTYLTSPFPPPGVIILPSLVSEPRPAFIPAIPEPLSLSTLPCALAAWFILRRPRLA